MYIDAIGLSNYRSFGHDVQRIGPFTNVNLFIGQNNSGKSNILSFINSHYSLAIGSLREGTNLEFGELDRHLGEKNDYRIIELGFPIGGDKYQKIFQQIPDFGRAQLERILGSQSIRHGTDVAWFRFVAHAPNDKLLRDPNFDKELRDELPVQTGVWRDAWRALKKQQSGGNDDQWVIETIVQLLSPLLEIPKIKLVSAIRRIGEMGSPLGDDYSGIGIIERLQQLQNPKYNQQKQRKAFDQINEFVREVVGNKSALLEVPHDRSIINVHMDDNVLPLSSLGREFTKSSFLRWLPRF